MSDRGDPEHGQWAPDPTGRHRYRFWDGYQWTGHVYDGEEVPRRPPRPRPEAAAEVGPEHRDVTDPGVGRAASERAAYGTARAEPADAHLVDHDEHDGHDEPGPDAVRQSFWKGAIVGGAVVAAIAILAYVTVGKKDDSTVATRTTTTTKPRATTTSSSTTTLLTTTTVAGRPPAQVRVVVQNGSGVSGGATTKATALKALGYTIAGTGNATARTGTVVECKPGFEAEANALALAVGGGATVAPFPSPAPSGTTSADCLVILGSSTSTGSSTTTT